MSNEITSGITNEITFGTDSASLAAFQKMLTEVRAEDGPFGSIDFNKLIPMPEALNIEAGARTSKGLRLYVAFVKDSRLLAYQGLFSSSNAHAAAVQAHLEKYTKLEQNDPEVWALGKQAAQNIIKFDAPTWYEWAEKNWGTHWNAYHCQPLDPGAHTMRFLTAWYTVPKVLEALSQKYPEQRVTYRWADEHIGYNVGEMAFENGREVGRDIPYEGSREAYEMAAEIRGVNLEDYGLYLSMDEMTYERREAPAAPPMEQPKKKTKRKGDAR